MKRVVKFINVTSYLKIIQILPAERRNSDKSPRILPKLPLPFQRGSQSVKFRSPHLVAGESLVTPAWRVWIWSLDGESLTPDKTLCGEYLPLPQLCYSADLLTSISWELSQLFSRLAHLLNPPRFYYTFVRAAFVIGVLAIPVLLAFSRSSEAGRKWTYVSLRGAVARAFCRERRSGHCCAKLRSCTQIPKYLNTC